MEKKKNGPQKGAGRKWAARLKELGQRPPPKDLVDKINEKDEQKKSANPAQTPQDLDI
jgi:hypothetical protein